MEYLDYSILITLVTVILLIILSYKSGAAKAKHGLKPYDTLENEEARIAHRIHMNTVESVVVFLPLLWIATLFSNAKTAVVLGVLWLIIRIVYARVYSKNPSKRSKFFAASLFICVAFILVILHGLFF